MDASIPFSKAEMLQQLSSALLIFIRSTSFVLDHDAGRRLLGWPSSEGHDALNQVDYIDFYEVARLEGQSLDLNRFSVYRTFSDLYDYGVLGVLQSNIFPIENASEATFAMGFVFDCFQSQLFFEMLNGDFLALGRCVQAARMTVARQVLDGGERCLVPMMGEAVPDGHLTIPEVALLANMEEGSVRNAASGRKTADSLVTVTREGKRFVTREDALNWLASRRGYRKTQVRGNLVDFDIRQRAFLGAWEVSEFLRQRAESLGITATELADRAGLPPSTDSADYRLRRLDDLCRSEVVTKLAELLQLEPRLLALRLEECRVEERVIELRRDIERVRSEGAT